MFYVVASSYSHVLYGYTVQASKEDDQALKITPLFIFKAHTQCIRTLAGRNCWLLSGSDDESIKVYRLDKKKETGTLLLHNGSVGSLEFIAEDKKTSSKWALSGAEDGKIILWRIHDWQPLLIINAHKESHTIHYSPVIAPHPSGKLALSIGSMCELKMWDLTNGKCSFRKTLPRSDRSTPWLVKGQMNSKGRELPIQLEWNPSGTAYTVLFPSHAISYNVESDQTLFQIEDEQLLMKMIYLSDDFIVISGDAGIITIFKTDGTKIRSIQAHKLRIKGLGTAPYESVHSSSTDKLPYLISTASDGTINIWDSNILCQNGDSDDISPTGSVDTKDRITALSISYPFNLSGSKRRREETEEEEEEEDEIEEEPVEEEQKKKKTRKLPKAKKPKVRITYE